MPIGGGKGGADFDPQGPLGRRGHAVLPVVHDRAVPAPRRAHRRAGRRHRRRRARDRLPVRPVQADHQPLRVRRADRQGPGLGRRAGAHRGDRLRRRVLRRGDARDAATTAFDGKTVVVSGSGNVAIYAIEKVHAARRDGRRLLGLRPATSSTRRASTSSCSSRSRRSSGPRIAEYADARRATAAFVAGRHASGRSPATSRCPARPRTSSTGEDAHDAGRATACIAVAEGANMPCTPEAVDAVPARPACVRARQGRQRRRRGDQRAGDAAERLARRLDLRAHRGAAREIMRDIHAAAATTAEEYGLPGDYVAGANIAASAGGRRDARAGPHLTSAPRRSTAFCGVFLCPLARALGNDLAGRVRPLPGCRTGRRDRTQSDCGPSSTSPVNRLYHHFVMATPVVNLTLIVCRKT